MTTSNHIKTQILRSAVIEEKVSPDSNLYEILASYSLMAYAMLEMLDNLKDTNMYRHDVKKQINLLDKAINNSDYYKRLDGMYNSDEEAVNNITSHYTRMFRTFAKFSPQHWGLLSEAAERLIENPELFAAMNNIQVGASDEIELMKKREQVTSLVNKMPDKQVDQIYNYVSGLANVFVIED